MHAVAGFPLSKAEAYVKLRRPFCVNDLASERLLLDRRGFYRKMTEHNIPVPRHVFVNRDDPSAEQVIVETDDYIEVDGVRINRPFVEKPVNAEDHNVYIYYPTRLGGGSKRLFRKVRCVGVCGPRRQPRASSPRVCPACRSAINPASSTRTSRKCDAKARTSMRSL